MSAYNTNLTVSDPDLLIAGNSPYAPFVVAKVQLYRWTTEALARVGSAGDGTLVTTFDLIASTEATTEAAGPYSFKVYDSGQGSGSWYRYRFADTALSSFSGFSEPWQSDGRTAWALRDIIWEVLNILGKSAVRGTATAGAASTLTCTAVFGSTLRNDNSYTGWWLLITYDAGAAAAAPEGEEALIASNVASTGIVTIERPWTAQPASGDLFLASAYIQPSEVVAAINRVREGMKVLRMVDIAYHAASSENMIPVPQGVYTSTDIYEVLGVQNLNPGNRNVETPVVYDVVQDGIQTWVRVYEDAAQFTHLRIVYEQSFLDYEGALVGMGDTTNAPIQWLRAAAAVEVMEQLAQDDPDQPEWGALLGTARSQLAIATGRKATRMPPRKAVQQRRGLVGPRTY